MAAERTYYTARHPGDLGGKKPKDFGTDRRCGCGTRILRYRKGVLCGLCEKNPERLGAALTNQENDMLGMKNKWKSRAYPDGCSECPEHDKLLRRHEGRGLCSKHYKAFKASQVDCETVEPLPGEYVDDVDPIGVDRDSLEAGDPRAAGLPDVCNGGGPCEDPEGCGQAGRCRILSGVTDHRVINNFSAPVRQLHREVAAMETVRAALEPLTRDEQVRAMRWATSHYGIDRPLPEDVVASQ